MSNNVLIYVVPTQKKVVGILDEDIFLGQSL